MSAHKPLKAYFIDEHGHQQVIAQNALYVELANGQVLTLDLSGRVEGLAILDHSVQPSEHGGAFACLSIMPSACNVVVINSNKHQAKAKSEPA